MLPESLVRELKTLRAAERLALTLLLSLAVGSVALLVASA